MRHRLRFFGFYIVCAFVWLLPLYCFADVVFHFPAFQTQPLQSPTWQNQVTGEGDILIDNFEYWDSPYNHGWMQLEPPYPVYGFGMGYAINFTTVLDLQEGSRVLDVYMPSFVFLLGTSYAKHGISHILYTPYSASSGAARDYIDLTNDHPVLSFKFRAPIGIEYWDIFELRVIGFAGSSGDQSVTVRILPSQSDADPYISKSFYYAKVTHFAENNPANSLEVTLYIGRGFLDGSWHVIWLDIPELVRTAVNEYDRIQTKADWYITRAKTLIVTGQMFRVDDIIFRTKDFTKLEPVDLFEPGPLYTQLFEPYRFLFMADYQASGTIGNLTDFFLLNPDSFITDPNRIRDVWIKDLLAIDPNYHCIDFTHPLYDPDYTKRWIPGDPNFSVPDSVAETYIRKGFFIDSTLAVLADSNFRMGGSRATELRNYGALKWNMTVNGYGENALQAFMIQPLPINPYDGMPTYMITKYKALLAIKTVGRYYYGPERCYTLESALWNAGILVWPNLAYVDYAPQSFEDLIVTIEVTNGFVSDTRVLPISVVNYPVENYPPVTQMNICARFFTVGQENECLILFLDPDCFMYSMAQYQGMLPASTHLPMLAGNQIRTDQGNLIHKMTINGYNTYQYGPWIDSIIDPHSGLTRFTPLFEGVLHSVVTCYDDRGGMAVGARSIFCVNTGTWLNHPPIVIASPARPQVVRAGEELIITDIVIQDPDADEIYTSSNIGSMGRMANGSFIWTFQTNFPGLYHIEVIFYDIRGGYAIMRIEVEVKPWWSY